MKASLFFTFLSLVFFVGCGNSAPDSSKHHTQRTEACIEDCPEQFPTGTGLRKTILDRPNRPNEFGVRLRWPGVPGAQGYRVLRTFVRGGRLGQHPNISTVQQPFLEDADLVGGSIVVYRVESITSDDSVSEVGEERIEVPIDIVWRGQIQSHQVAEATRDHIVNRVIFEKDAVVVLDERNLVIDAQHLTFHETVFVSFANQNNSQVAGSPSVYGATGHTGVTGRSGGFLKIRAKSVRGTARFILNGENGGTGGSGFGGAPGNDGGGGDISCSQRRGTDGAAGGAGGVGGSGGSSGMLYLEAADASMFNYTVSGLPGAGGRGGFGGPGGLRGVGKTVYCGLGTLGAPLAGYAGNSGAPGPEGSSGVAGQKRPVCVILGTKVSETVEGSCQQMLSQRR